MMMHQPIYIRDLELSFTHKTCFENFDYQILYGQRIAIIGRNGCGKSTLLKMIHALCQEKTSSAYVPQVIESDTECSGGERLKKAITEALATNPSILLLDEPTNHLDRKNRQSLFHMLRKYEGTLIFVSHDKELLRECDTLWHIDQGHIRVFSGQYDHYIHEIAIQRQVIEHELMRLKQQKNHIHMELMQEQQRAAKSKKKGEKSIDQRKWPTIVSKAKALRAEETSGKKKSAIEQRKSDLTERLSELYLPEVIIPTFSLEHRGHSQKTLIQISNGSVGYESHKPILSKIYFQLESAQRIAIEGANGSGKSTFIKAILQDTKTYRGGEWYSIKRNDIGYLDQHYGTLPEDLTVLDCAREYAPNWSIAEVRFHLSTFLFRKNEEVATQVKHLSGGEKARLSLALLAICTPNLLILDEVSNNLDLETKTHVTEVLNCYPGAIIAISHDQAFLKELRIDEIIDIEKWRSIED